MSTIERLAGASILVTVLIASNGCGGERSDESAVPAEGRGVPNSLEEFLLAETLSSGTTQDVDELDDSFGLLMEMTGMDERSSTETSTWMQEQLELNEVFHEWVQDHMPEALKALGDEPSAAVPFYNEIISITGERMEERSAQTNNPEYREIVLRVIGQAVRHSIGDFSGLDWDGFHWMPNALKALDMSALDQTQRDTLRVHIAGMFAYAHLTAGTDERDFFELVAWQIRDDFGQFVQGR